MDAKKMVQMAALSSELILLTQKFLDGEKQLNEEQVAPGTDVVAMHDEVNVA